MVVGNRVNELLNKGGQPEAYTADEIIRAIRANKGMVSHAAKSLGTSRSTLKRYVDTYPEVQEAVYEAREDMGDTAEGKLFEAILNGEPWAITFYLKTQHKARGYIERSQHVNVNIDIALLQKFENAATTAGLQPSQIIEALIEQVTNAAPLLPGGDVDTTEGDNRT